MDALQAGDDLLALAEVLQRDVDHALGAVVLDGEGLDVALVEQDLRNGLLEVGSGDVDRRVLRVVGIADAGQHVRNGIGDLHVILLLIEVTGLKPVAVPGYPRE